MPGTILIVDDDKAVASVLKVTLKEYKVKHVLDADAAYRLLRSEKFDVILLDYNLPGISGMTLLELLKKEPETAGIPVIMMTVKADEKTKVKGLESGCDDYIVKPFSAEEVLARIHAVLRRVHQGGRLQNVLQSGKIRVDVDNREASVEGKRLELTPGEFRLLAALIRRKGMILSFQTLSEAVGEGRDVTSETIYVYVNGLRKKLGKHASTIETVHGVGYKFLGN